MNCNRRNDKLLAQHIEVALVYKEMLGLEEAIDYLRRESVPRDIVQRVLLSERRRLQAAPGLVAPAALPYARCRRKNHVHDAIVEAALKIERKLGVAWALTLLRNEGLPEDVVARLTAMGPRQLRLRTYSNRE